MQTLNWYYNRLKAMSPGEIAWRMQSSLRDRADRLLISHRQRLRNPVAIFNGEGGNVKPGFHVSDLAIEEKQHNSLLARAEKIAEHRLTFFDLENKHLGDPIIWNRDHKRQQDTPMVFSPSLDYRDIKEAGDCKYVWEPNRHHQFVVLARAYRISGDVRFAQAIAEQLDSWLRQNPYGLGMNWRSGLELGIRLINWVWALDLIEDSKVIGEELFLRIMDSVSRHIWEIDRKYSQGSSVNNHLIGEAAGVFVASSYFNYLKHASKWRDRSRDIIIREILNQTYSDGGSMEQAIGYHNFIMQFFIIAGITARATGRDFPESYWSRLEKMFEFTAKLSEGSNNLPMFGDCDDGYVLDIGDNPHSIKDWLILGVELFGRSDFYTSSSSVSKQVEILPGKSGSDKYGITHNSEKGKCSSFVFSQSGYYLLQYGENDSQNCISVVFDCGPLGMGALAGHGHADALSFTLRAFGRDVLVDPGTYDYFSYPQWREYFRSTRSHNTVVIDDRDQSEMLGPFLWGRKANAHCLVWEPSDIGGRVVGEHDGYTGLNDPVTHRRTLELNGPGRSLIIRDDIMARGKHDMAVLFHLAESCVVNPAGRNRYRIDVGPGTVEIELDSCLHVELFRGSTNPIYGWVSRDYHQKRECTTLVGRYTAEGDTSFVSRIEIRK